MTVVGGGRKGRETSWRCVLDNGDAMASIALRSPEEMNVSGRNGQDYATATAHSLAAALAARKVSAVELFEAAVERIERLDGPVNAVVVRDFDRAHAAAEDAGQALERGGRGPVLFV